MKGREPDTNHSFDYLADLYAKERRTKNPGDKPKKRLCLRCGLPFRSRGVTNRVCSDCKELNHGAAMSEAKKVVERRGNE
jgi:hypothetical protein